MADNNSEDSVVLPVAAGVAGVGVGGVAAAHALYQDKDMPGNLLQARADKYNAILASGEKWDKVLQDMSPQDRTLMRHYNAAQNAKILAEGNHAAAIKAAASDAIKGMDGATQGKLEISALQSELKHLESGTSAVYPRNFHIETRKAQINAIEDTLKGEGFKDLSATDATHAIQEAKQTAANEFRETARAYQNYDAHAAKVQEFETLHAEGLDTVRHKAIASSKEVAEKIEPHTRLTQSQLKAADHNFDSVKHWEARRDKLMGSEGRHFKAAEENLGKLQNIEKINAERSGFWSAVKRPVQLMKEGGHGARFAIVASAVALCAATYAGARALTGHKEEPQPQSYAARIQQQRMTQMNADRGV